jgi:hypothetical protein
MANVEPRAKNSAKAITGAFMMSILSIREAPAIVVQGRSFLMDRASTIHLVDRADGQPIFRH